MAFQTTHFVDPLPKLSENNWFSLDERLDDDALLIQEEEEYKLQIKEIADKGYDLISIGQTKEASEVADADEGEMEDEGEDEESGGELDDETDEYESTSPAALAAVLSGAQEVEMGVANGNDDATESSSWI